VRVVVLLVLAELQGRGRRPEQHSRPLGELQ
jgi:hypothetical protein